LFSVGTPLPRGTMPFFANYAAIIDGMLIGEYGTPRASSPTGLRKFYCLCVTFLLVADCGAFVNAPYRFVLPL